MGKFVEEIKRGDRKRLFCFPYAGGGVSIYRDWQEAFKNVSVYAMQYPGKEKQPCCENGNIYFNITKDCVAVVFYKKPTGIDVEYINKKLEWKDIAESVFNKRECASLAEMNEVEKFYMHWVYKEAIAKAYGCGLETEFTKSFYLKDVTYGINNVYGNENLLFGTVELFKIGEEYAVATASKREGGEIL